MMSFLRCDSSLSCCWRVRRELLAHAALARHSLEDPTSTRSTRFVVLPFFFLFKDEALFALEKVLSTASFVPIHRCDQRLSDGHKPTTTEDAPFKRFERLNDIPDCVCVDDRVRTIRQCRRDCRCGGGGGAGPRRDVDHKG